MSLKNDVHGFLVIALLSVAWQGVSAGQREPRQPLRIVIVAEGPTWNQRFLTAALQRDRGLKCVSILVQEETKVSQHLADCSVLVMVDLSDEVFDRDPDLAQQIAPLVNRGGGLVVLASGPWPDDGPLAELLPVKLAKAKLTEDDDAPALSHPTITSAGLRTSFLRFVDDPMRNQELWREKLGQSFGPPIAVLPHADANVLAIDPHRKLEGQSVPLIAVREVGMGRVVFVNNGQTWRWRKDPLGNYHDRLCQRMTRFAAGDVDN